MLGLRDYASPIGALFLVTAMLLWPAIWNGAPLFYYDSVDYLVMPFSGNLPVFRTAPYGWFQWFARLSGSLWLPIIVQALMVSAMIWLSVRSLVATLPAHWYLFGMAVVALLTGLPWYVSQIMADSMTAATYLAAIALCCGTFRSRAALWSLAGMTAIAISFHISHLAVISGLAVCVLFGRLLVRLWPAMPPVRVLPLLATALLAIGISVASNAAATGKMFLFRDPANLRLALFVETGLVQRYLDEVCPAREPAWLLCAYRNRLPTNANAYLWNTFGPFHELGGWRSEPHEREAKALVRAIVEQYPVETLKRLGKAALWQFGMVQTGDGIRPMHWHLEKPIRLLYHDFLGEFLDAEQQKQPIDFDTYASRDPVLYWTALAAMVFFAVGRWLSGSRWPALAALFVFLTLAGNAIVCGALSNPNHRYQGRIGSLPLLVVLLIGADFVISRRRSE